MRRAGLCSPTGAANLKEAADQLGGALLDRTGKHSEWGAPVDKMAGTAGPVGTAGTIREGDKKKICKPTALERIREPLALLQQLRQRESANDPGND
ncbi:hypothetical protein NDU88_002336 [Pleurodeles waltl]|uniref:Uncharacterized protein n=1 Tax=Pleurodeles waltl TaxID=8319 RepID=A0AAV7SEI0_PLEWA|nr:hypothetical protein NDU88_002336 [Pleurodeles waltl]